MIDLPKRKPVRIAGYDYSAAGAYFITVCIHGRKPILWNVGAATCRPFFMRGKIFTTEYQFGILMSKGDSA